MTDTAQIPTYDTAYIAARFGISQRHARRLCRAVLDVRSRYKLTDSELSAVEKRYDRDCRRGASKILCPTNGHNPA